MRFLEGGDFRWSEAQWMASARNDHFWRSVCCYPFIQFNNNSTRGRLKLAVTLLWPFDVRVVLFGEGLIQSVNGCSWIFNRSRGETSTQSHCRRRNCDLLLYRMTSEASAGNADDKMTELPLESSVSVDDEATEMISPPAHPSVPVLKIELDKWVHWNFSKLFQLRLLCILNFLCYVSWIFSEATGMSNDTSFVSNCYIYFTIPHLVLFSDQ